MMAEQTPTAAHCQIKILPRISVTGISMSVVVVGIVANGSLGLAARATVLQAFLFD
jgi:hypothetical protein